MPEPALPVSLGDADMVARREAATRAAREAGDHLKSLFAVRDTLVTQSKGPQDFVSRADKEAEDIIADILCGGFAGDGFLGEESGRSGPEDAPLVWAVDPLDGTTNFLRGLEAFCVSIGAFVAGEPVLGVIHMPLMDETFVALKGHGATLNGTPIVATSVPSLSQALLGIGHSPRQPSSVWRAETHSLMSRGVAFRQTGAGAHMLACVACGRLDGYYERHMWPWDAAAGLALIREAGGDAVPYGDGERGWEEGGRVIAAGRALLPDMIDALGTATSSDS